MRLHNMWTHTRFSISIAMQNLVCVSNYVKTRFRFAFRPSIFHGIYVYLLHSSLFNVIHFRSNGLEKMYLPLYKVAHTPFQRKKKDYYRHLCFCKRINIVYKT